MFPLPEEQDKDVHFIVTGNAGIGIWVAERHLQDFVHDLPLFTSEALYEYALKLVDCLGLCTETLTEFLSVPPKGVADCLEQ